MITGTNSKLELVNGFELIIAMDYRGRHGCIGRIALRRRRHCCRRFSPGVWFMARLPSTAARVTANQLDLRFPMAPLNFNSGTVGITGAAGVSLAAQRSWERTSPSTPTIT